MKFVRSPVTSNSNVGPFGAYMGQIFCSNDVSKVIKSGGLSKISSELWAASTGKILGSISNFGEKIGPTSLHAFSGSNVFAGLSFAPFISCSSSQLFLHCFT